MLYSKTTPDFHKLFYAGDQVFLHFNILRVDQVQLAMKVWQLRCVVKVWSVVKSVSKVSKASFKCYFVGVFKNCSRTYKP